MLFSELDSIHFVEKNPIRRQVKSTILHETSSSQNSLIMVSFSVYLRSDLCSVASHSHPFTNKELVSD